MTTINDAYINALLADATYALDEKVINGSSDTALFDKLQGRLTPTLAKYIGDNFTVVTHYESSAAGFEDEGFDGSVWKSGDQYYFSARGTTPGDLHDIGEDITLGITGLAIEQTLEMVNWWL